MTIIMNILKHIKTYKTYKKLIALFNESNKTLEYKNVNHVYITSWETVENETNKLISYIK